ncbi:cell division cycle protein 42-like [Pelomyxa schiedti]|nr:cell division cycle protein 42-like [Pelomyxa schiedti]
MRRRTRIDQTVWTLATTDIENDTHSPDADTTAASVTPPSSHNRPRWRYGHTLTRVPPPTCDAFVNPGALTTPVQAAPPGSPMAMPLRESDYGSHGILFGGAFVEDGEGGDGGIQFLSDVWVMRPEGSYGRAGGYWDEISTTGAPDKGLGRSHHSAVYSRSCDSLFIFGGRNMFIRNDLWQLSLASNSWKLLSPQGFESETSPNMRYGHSAVLFNETIFIFGGYDCNGMARHDVYAFSTQSKSWVTVVVRGEIPPRYFHSACEFKGSMYVFGGLSANTRDPVDNHLWQLNLETLQWSAITVTGDVPASRWASSHAIDDGCGQFIVFGGKFPLTGKPKVKNSAAAAIYTLNLQSKVWTAQSPKYSGSLFREHSFGAACIFRDYLYITGGQIFTAEGATSSVKCIMLVAVKQDPMQVNIIPDDVLYHIFSFLGSPVYLALSGAVCKQWYRVTCLNDDLWVPFSRGLPEASLDTPSARSKVIFWKTSVHNNKNKIASGFQSIKLVIVGNGAVGKTCAMLTYLSQSFPSEYIPTCGFDNPSCNIRVENGNFNVNIWDTAGQEEYDRLRPLSYPQTDIFIIMFSVENRASMNNVEEKWIPEVQRHVPKAPILLVASKIDLRSDATKNCISPAEVEALSRKLKLPYCEISSLKSYASLQVMMETAVRCCLSTYFPVKNRVTPDKCSLQ